MYLGECTHECVRECVRQLTSRGRHSGSEYRCLAPPLRVREFTDDVILVWPTSWTPAVGGLFVCV